MTNAMTVCRGRIEILWLIALTLTGVLLLVAQPAWAANVQEVDDPMGDAERPVQGTAAQERVVTVPEPPDWNGWISSHPGQHRSAPRVQVWVDRGDWATYSPGDRLWVYFRVDRPCYVTILDYSPDGRVDMLYPNRWSGSNFVSPGRTYRIPESRRYSLRIAGVGGVETLVACAHEAPWPSGPGGVWIPRHRPTRGRVVVGRPGGSPLPGWPGRVVVSPGRWPVPPAWHDRPDRWTCDSVSFYVSAGGDWWRGGAWEPGGPVDRWGYGEPYDSRWHDMWSQGGRLLLNERFTLRGCSDGFSRDVRTNRVDARVTIDCVESSNGDPTEIVGRITFEGGWESDVIFRLDVEGEHGQKPWRGGSFNGYWGGVRVEAQVVDFRLATTRRWQIPRFEWVEFDLKVYEE